MSDTAVLVLAVVAAWLCSVVLIVAALSMLTGRRKRADGIARDMHLPWGSCKG